MNKKKIFAIASLLSLFLVSAFFVTNVMAGASSEAKGCEDAIRLLGEYDAGSFWDADSETCMLRYEYPEFSNTCYPAYDQNLVVYQLGNEEPLAQLQMMGCSE